MTDPTIPLEFHSFPHLATEIRLKIWKYATYLSPRIVELCQLQDEENIYHPDPDEYRTINQAPFFSPTPVPALLQVNSESRDVTALQYPLCFPNTQSGHPARVRFNAEIDTLYFPSWCFKDDIRFFEVASSQETKNSIRKIARDSLLWYSPPWTEGTINNQLTIEEFAGLQELVLVNRSLDGIGCACCHDFESEHGVVGLSFIEETKWEQKCRKGVEEVLEEIKNEKGEKGENWNIPQLKFAQLLRDGVEV
jgi:hypothetical protein